MLKLIIQISFVILISATMGWLGLWLIFLGHFFPAYTEFWTQYVVLASVGLWLTAFLFKGTSTTQSWVRFGFFSPILGCLLVAPPASFSLVLIRFYISFPVGMATGFLIGKSLNLSLANKNYD